MSNHNISQKRKSQKIVWITGASSGIGRETAKRLARDGWTVCASARSEDKLKSLSEECTKMPGVIMPFPCDVTDEDKVSKVIKTIEESVGQIDMVLLNAGTYISNSVEDFTAESFKKHVKVNLEGTVNCVAAILPYLLKRNEGHIAIVASVAGYRGLPRSISYGATKAALQNMAEALAIETLDKNIKIQIINPGFVKTPLTDKNDFYMPMLMEVEKAADKLVKGLYSNKFEITFPVAFAEILKFIGLLPHKLYIRLIYKITKGKLN